MIQNMGTSLKDQGPLEFLREALSSINLKVLLMICDWNLIFCDFWYGIHEKFQIFFSDDNNFAMKVFFLIKKTGSGSLCVAMHKFCWNNKLMNKLKSRLCFLDNACAGGRVVSW